MKMSEGTEDKQTELQRLLAELDQLEQERHALNLRDPQAVDECQRKIDVLRLRINALDLA
jgi:hypothetical protein